MMGSAADTVPSVPCRAKQPCTANRTCELAAKQNLRLEAQVQCWQSSALKARSSSVTHLWHSARAEQRVTNQRVPQSRHVDADLVRTPRQYGHLQAATRHRMPTVNL